MQRFTPDARHVIVLANRAAEQLGHDFISTGHISVGLLSPDAGLVLMLNAVGVDVPELGSRFDALIADNTHGTLTAKGVIEAAVRDADARNHSVIGVERLALAVLSDETSSFTLAVAADSVDLEAVRSALAQRVEESES